MERAGSTGSLAELASEVSLFALGMRDRAQLAQFPAVREGATKLLEEFESKAKAERIDPGDIADAKFALAAFVDEEVLNADWAGREQWAEDPLQLHYFGTFLAGEGFFEKLETLRAQAKTRANTLRVYYQCLQLGFKGKYGIAGQEILDALKKVVQNTLEQEGGGEPAELCPHWKPADKPSAHKDNLPRWFFYVCVGVAATCLLIYAVFFFSLKAQSQEAPKPHAAGHSLSSEMPGGEAA